MRYFRPNSLTWWAGVFLAASGVAQAAGWPLLAGDPTAGGLAGVLTALRDALTAILGVGEVRMSPSVQIGLGFGLIGVRDALARDRQAADVRHAELMTEQMAFIAWDEFDDDGDGDLLDDELLAANMFRHGQVRPGESPLPPGVIDPYGEGGSRG